MIKQRFNQIVRSAKLTAVILTVSTTILATPIRAFAAINNPASSAKVSFTFDDSYTSAISKAAPTLASHGLTGTDYAITGCIGMTTAPNTCRANEDATYLSWDQITQLQNTFGWEIGSHTVTHPYLASKDADDGQPNKLSLTQVRNELNNSKTALASHGVDAVSFSSPYGDYDSVTLAEIAKVYSSNRGFADQKNNDWPYSEYILNNFPVQAGVTVDQVKAKIDEAIATNNWLILTFHDIKDVASTNPDDFEYSTADLDQIAAYVESKQAAGQIKSVNVKQGNVASDTNLLPNGSFNNGIAEGWTKDSTNIVKDTATNGSYPDAKNSIRLVSTNKEIHLLSPKVAVDNQNTYLLKNYLKVLKRTSGEIGFYIDEYSSTGVWLSGQYRKAENSVFTENLNFTYTPTSANVKQARLQVLVTANSGITAYLDNTQWFAVTNNVTTPPVQPTNLMTDSTFESGFTGGWSTDVASNVKLDVNNNGSSENPKNSVRMQSLSGKNVHLFSPKIAVSSTKQYTISSYLYLKAIKAGTVIGFYVDEYDANGNWISGQYKTERGAIMQDDVVFDYNPSSVNVAQASLQVIVTAGSNMDSYIDNVLWLVI